MSIQCLAVLVAAGDGIRLGRPEGKARVALAGRPLFLHSAEKILQLPGLLALVIVARAADQLPIREALAPVLSCLGDSKPPNGSAPAVLIVSGGSSRQESVRLGLQALSEAGFASPDRPVLIHDAARPLATSDLFAAVLEAAAAAGPRAVIGPAVPAADALRRQAGSVPAVAPPQGPGVQSSTAMERTGIWQIQTPQAGWIQPMLEAHCAPGAADASLTDDLAAGEAIGLDVQLVCGERSNLKITWPDDLALAESLVHAGRLARVGLGFDVHPLVAGRSVRLGGVDIDAPYRLDGHSDADVAVHALMDAILGAAAKGDIGQWFPPDDSKWRGANSLDLLAGVWAALAAEGWLFGNADLVIAAEKPRLSPHYPAMRAAIASALATDSDRISVKATTTERLGFVGREEGIAAMATVSLLGPKPRRVPTQEARGRA